MQTKLGLRLAFQQDGKKVVVFLSPEEWREVFEVRQEKTTAGLREIHESAD